jgi:hypothetical protein
MALETFLSSWINFPDLIDLMSLEVYKAFQLVAMPGLPNDLNTTNQQRDSSTKAV